MTIGIGINTIGYECPKGQKWDKITRKCIKEDRNMSIVDKLDRLITDQDKKSGEDSNIDEFIDTDDEIIDLCFELIESLEDVTDEQADIIAEILEIVDPDEELSEVFKKRQRRDLAAQRQRRREYRRKRAQTKIKARKYRRSALGKKTLRKAKRFAKMGRTSTMKRQRKFVGPQLSKLR